MTAATLMQAAERATDPRMKEVLAWKAGQAAITEKPSDPVVTYHEVRMEAFNWNFSREVRRP